MVTIIEPCGVVIIVRVIVLYAVMVAVIMPCGVVVMMGGIVPRGAAPVVIVHCILVATCHHHCAIGAWWLEYKRGS